MHSLNEQHCIRRSLYLRRHTSVSSDRPKLFSLILLFLISSSSFKPTADAAITTLSSFASFSSPVPLLPTSLQPSFFFYSSSPQILLFIPVSPPALSPSPLTKSISHFQSYPSWDNRLEDIAEWLNTWPQLHFQTKSTLLSYCFSASTWTGDRSRHL